MASGVKITDDVKVAYTQVGFQRSGAQKLKCAVFKFSDKLDKIELERTVVNSPDTEVDYDEFITDILGPTQVRYIVYDFPHLNKDGAPTSTIIFLSWNPQGVSIKMRMLLASSLNSLRSTLNLNNVVEASEMSEADSKAILEKIGGQPLKK